MSQDKRLQRWVADELSWKPSVTASAAVAMLTGQFETFVHKQGAEAAAYRVKGVKAVAEDIEVRSPIDTQRSDDIMQALHRSWYFDPETINVSAETGRIRLTGVVHFQHDRQVTAETT